MPAAGRHRESPDTPWKAPYVRFQLLESFLASADSIVDAATLQSALDGIAAPSARSELRTALLALGLMDTDGVPSIQVARYARKPQERPAVIKDLLDRFYPAAVPVAVGGAQRDDIAAAFDPPITLAGTGGRAVTLLLAMIEAAGELVPPVSESPSPVRTSDDRYGSALEGAIERLAQLDLSDDVVWARFNELSDRYEKWSKRRR